MVQLSREASKICTALRPYECHSSKPFVKMDHLRYSPLQCLGRKQQLSLLASPPFPMPWVTLDSDVFLNRWEQESFIQCT